VGIAAIPACGHKIKPANSDNAIAWSRLPDLEKVGFI
jgi:hypothetical protein